VLTTLHLNFEDEARGVLGIPTDVLQVALIPVAHARDGAFRPASRPGVGEVVFGDRWGRPAKESP
jgi:hypothetical protein